MKMTTATTINRNNDKPHVSLRRGTGTGAGTGEDEDEDASTPTVTTTSERQMAEDADASSSFLSSSSSSSSTATRRLPPASTRPQTGVSPMGLLAQQGSSKHTPTDESRRPVNTTTTAASLLNVTDPQFDLEDWQGEAVPANFTNGSVEFETEKEPMDNDKDDGWEGAMLPSMNSNSTATSSGTSSSTAPTTNSTEVEVAATITTNTSTNITEDGMANENITTTTTTTIVTNSTSTTNNADTSSNTTTIPLTPDIESSSSNSTAVGGGNSTKSPPTASPTIYEEKPPLPPDETFHDGEHPVLEDDDDAVIVKPPIGTPPPPPSPPPAALPTSTTGGGGMNSGGTGGGNAFGGKDDIIDSPTTTDGDGDDHEMICGSPFSLNKSILQCHQQHHPYQFYGTVIGLALIVIWFLRRSCCGSAGRSGSGGFSSDSRGEYRAVAAQFAQSGYDNTFSDELSDDGGGAFVDSDDEDFHLEDSTWDKSGQRAVLEMGTFRSQEKGMNGGLSLKEMNG